MFLTLTGDRVGIRPVREADLVHFHTWWNDTVLMREVLAEDFSIDMTTLQRVYWPAWESPGPYDQWMHVICLDDNPIGEITWERLKGEQDIAEIHLKIGVPGLWNQGLGPDALRTVLRALLARPDVARVRLQPGVHNPRMTKVCKKLGLVQLRSETDPEALRFEARREDLAALEGMWRAQ